LVGLRLAGQDAEDRALVAGQRFEVEHLLAQVPMACRMRVLALPVAPQMTVKRNCAGNSSRRAMTWPRQAL
jgi:hypothetical protein